MLKMQIYHQNENCSTYQCSLKILNFIIMHTQFTVQTVSRRLSHRTVCTVCLFLWLVRWDESGFRLWMMQHAEICSVLLFLSSCVQMVLIQLLYVPHWQVNVKVCVCVCVCVCACMCVYVCVNTSDKCSTLFANNLVKCFKKHHHTVARQSRHILVKNILACNLIVRF